MEMTKMNSQVAGALKELAEQFKEAWPDHTGKYDFLIGAGHNIAKALATPAPIPNTDRSEYVRAMVPDGWLVEKMADNGVSGFIVRTPRAEGVRTCTAVFPDDDDPAHRLLAMLLASPSAKGGE